MRASSPRLRGLLPLTSVLAALAVLATTGCKKKSYGDHDPPPPNNSETRQQAGAEIAPAPKLPERGAPVLVGPPGKDADGFPTANVDRAVLRAMLFRGEYADLTKAIEDLQREFEADNAKETWVVDAMSAFGSAEPALNAPLDQWVAATPASFAPYLARAAHLHDVAWAIRGHGWIKDTSADERKGMRETDARARADVDKAIAIAPKLVAGQRLRIDIARGESDVETGEKSLREGLAECPSCFRLRVSYMTQLTPRWGGSYAKMEAFAKTSAGAGKKMNLLAGYIDFDKANVLRNAKQKDEALAEIDKACARGEYWVFLAERGELRIMVDKDPARGLADLERAAALHPGEPSILASRAWAYEVTKRWEDAGKDLRAIFLVEPTNQEAKRMLPDVVRGLIWEASEHKKAGRREASIRVLDLAVELAPNDPNVRQHRAWTILGDAGAGGIASLRAKVAAEPDNFDAHRQLDHALAREHNYAEVLTLWNTYLAAHPNDGPAYMERGGAYWNLGKQAEAKADATKACGLGLSEACAKLKSL